MLGYEISDTYVTFITGCTLQVAEYKYSGSLLRYDLLHDRVYFVPTCLVFAGPVTNEEHMVNEIIIISTRSQT